MSLLTVENLQTVFDTPEGVVHAVDGVDLTIDSGETVGLVGESGSGKSVLAQSLTRLVDTEGEMTADRLTFRGESLLEKSEPQLRELRGNSISMVFQDAMKSLNPTITVGEQIAETVRMHQDVGERVTLPTELKRKILGTATNSESWRRAIEMLETVSIPEADTRAAAHPHEFSGGMRQRAMIAMALSCEPDLLIADEPTTALDVTIQAQILDELNDLQEAFGTAVLLITHDLPVVAETCERVNVMYAGEIVEKAATTDLFENPQHPYTQALIASTPRVSEPVADLATIPGNVPNLIGIDQACHFAPRCPEAKAECFDIEPGFRPVGDDGGDHTAACLRRGPPEERL